MIHEHNKIGYGHVLGLFRTEHVWILSGVDELNKLEDAIGWLKTKLLLKKNDAVILVNERAQQATEAFNQAMVEYEEMCIDHANIHWSIRWIIPSPLKPKMEIVHSLTLNAIEQALLTCQVLLTKLSKLDYKFGAIEFVTDGDVPIEVQLVELRSGYWDKHLVDQYINHHVDCMTDIA